MLIHHSLRDPILINTIGHTAGVLLFGVIIILLIRDWRRDGLRRINLSLIAALLALVWNIGSLIALAMPDPDPLVLEILVTVNFSVLSLLPAVLLQVTLQGQHRSIVIAGYVVSGCAIVLHFFEPFSSGIGLHQAGLFTIVIGFGVLTLYAFFSRRTPRGGTANQRSEWISLACLLLFTTSFFHFGSQHVRSPWAAEITWHHIGIPVALIVLLQDYRFLLLDTFIRFLVNSGLAALYITAMLVLNQRFGIVNWTESSMFSTGIVLVALCLSLIVFVDLRNAAQAWVSRVLFRRQSLDECLKEMTNLASSSHSEDELLTRATQHIGRHLQTRARVATHLGEKERLEQPSVLPHDRAITAFPPQVFRAEGQIPLRFSSGDFRFILLGARAGGRRYLSEDLEDMRRLGSAVVEQVERFRAEELRRLVTQAELRALQAQINPHFLFNALNTLYGTIDRRSFEARRMVLNLAEIFRYVLRAEQTVIALSEELRIVEAYLEIEKLRFGERLETELVISQSARNMLIPILSVQPLVENAVKHGIAAKQGRGRVCVTAEKTSEGLRVTVEDTGVGFERSRASSQGGNGVGIDNVRQRLKLCYGAAADLKIRSTADGATVEFLVPEPTRTVPAAAQIEVRV